MPVDKKQKPAHDRIMNGRRREKQLLLFGKALPVQRRRLSEIISKSEVTKNSMTREEYMATVKRLPGNVS